METYEYVGRNPRGESMKGTIESSSPQAVAAWLAGSGISPVSIEVQQKHKVRPSWFSQLKGRETVSALDLLLFTRQMANMVRAGLQVIQAIEGIQRSTGSPALSRVLTAVRDDLDRGVVLSNAFSRHPDVFNEYYVNMVKVGESTGELQAAFQNLYSQIDFDRQMRMKIKTALRYPVFVMTALVIALTVLTLFVIPSFAKTYEGLKVDLPFLTRVLIGASNFAVGYWWAMLLGVGLFYYVVLLVLRTPEGRYNWDKFKLRLPVVGHVIYKATVARFARSFATAIKADMPLVTAFQLVAGVVDNSFFADRILQMRKGVERGEVLSRVMRTAGIFTSLELQLIEVSEHTGEVERAVDEISHLYNEEVDYEIGKLSQSIEPILLSVMGLMVLVLLLGIFLPLWDLGQAQLHR